MLLLAVFGILFFCFSSADYLNWLDFKSNVNWAGNSVYSSKLSVLWYSNSLSWLVCFRINDFWWGSKLQIFYVNDHNIRYSTESIYHQNLFGCFWFSVWEANDYNIYISDSDWRAVSFNIDFYYLSSVSVVSWNPWYTSLQCQTEYNLIPVESVDQNYCTTNNLCPSVDCPEIPDNPNIWTSNIYINDIFHPGAFNVIMNIPEEIDWDYAYTNSWQNINIDVVWYNQDFEKIEWWINTNNYKPTSEDFTKIFTSFSSFWWLLIACLFVILVFYFVKKMFK